MTEEIYNNIARRSLNFLRFIVFQIVIQQKDGVCPSPTAMAEQVLSYMESNGYLRA